MSEYDPRLVFLHADMDAFFASVEVLDDPRLKGKAVIVGHPGPRGVVSAASYEARTFGVHSALPSTIAKQRCPEAIWRPHRMSRYSQLSRQIQKIFAQFTPELEPISVDEAFLDVRASLRLFGGAIEIAKQLRQRVFQETGGLTVSVGVAPNKFLAKLASDLDKPDGLSVISPDHIQETLNPLPIRKLWGVGKKTAEVMTALGFHTIGDLARQELVFMQSQFGKASGEHLYQLCRGRDLRKIQTSHTAKSISTENTFEKDVQDADKIENFLFRAAEQVGASLRAEDFKAKTVQLKVRSASFKTFTRSISLESHTDETLVLYHKALEMFQQRIDLKGEGIRLVGLGAKNLTKSVSEVQQSLFEEPHEKEIQSGKKSDELSDRIKRQFGDHAITRARLVKRKKEN